LVLLCGFVLVSLSFKNARDRSVGAVALPCNEKTFASGGEASGLPPTQYFYSDQYGWFDSSHFDTGNPGGVIADVDRVIGYGGGVVAISQGVQNGVTGYTGYYWVSGQLTADQVIGVALGVYMDWSWRFEAWQGEPPRSILAPFTSFAVEDLPSQYLGFYAQALEIPIDHILACYLGEVTATVESPPHWVIQELSDEAATETGLQRLQNSTFYPMVEVDGSWQIMPWPAELRLTPVDSARNTWRFLVGETWYLNAETGREKSMDLPLSLRLEEPR